MAVRKKEKRQWRLGEYWSMINEVHVEGYTLSGPLNYTSKTAKKSNYNINKRIINKQQSPAIG